MTWTRTRRYATALQQAVSPPVHEVVLLCFVMLIMPLCYLLTPIGRRWILLTFPGQQTESLAAQGESAAWNHA